MYTKRSLGEHILKMFAEFPTDVVIHLLEVILTFEVF